MAWVFRSRTSLVWLLLVLATFEASRVFRRLLSL